MEKTKESKAITLIALTITIVVLLILSGIAILTLTGNNGLITQANRAKEETERAEKEEKYNLAQQEDLINEYITGITVEQVTDTNAGVLEIDEQNTNTYIINSIEDLVFFAYDVTNGNTYEGKTVKLGLSLDFNSTKSYVDPLRTDYGKYGYNGELKILLTSGKGFNMIGSTENDENGFYGNFEGNGYMIRNLFINEFMSEGSDYKFYGLFSKNYGTITNLDIMGSIKVISYSNNILVGLVAGMNNGTIQNCLSKGNIYIEGYQDEEYIAVGGITGQINSGGIIEKCGNTAQIIGKAKKIYAGGIVGSNNNQVVNSYNTAKLQINKNAETYTIWTGGITGYTGKGNIDQCFNIAQIVSDGYVGAICGLLGGSGEVRVKKCKYKNNDIEGIGIIVYVPDNYIEVENDTDLNMKEILNILNDI